MPWQPGDDDQSDLNVLVHWSPKSLEDVDIPDSAKRFLIERGLPVPLFREINFESEAAPRDPDMPWLRKIGSFRGSSFLLDESERGRVVYKMKGREPLLVNSSVQLFADFLWECNGFTLAPGRSKNGFDRLLAYLREKDPVAMEGPSSYWVEFLEDDE